jgi:ParB/RepB/Spo0J family partition protein
MSAITKMRKAGRAAAEHTKTHIAVYDSLAPKTSANISTEAATGIPIEKIEPGDNAREFFDEEFIKELSESIKANGLVQDIAVRRIPGGRYRIIAGETRFRAIKLLNWETAPCKLIEPDAEEDVLGLLENIQRKNLLPGEEARNIRKIRIIHNLDTARKLADKIKKSLPITRNIIVHGDRIHILEEAGFRADLTKWKVILETPQSVFVELRTAKSPDDIWAAVQAYTKNDSSIQDLRRTKGSKKRKSKQSKADSKPPQWAKRHSAYNKLSSRQKAKADAAAAKLITLRESEAKTIQTLMELGYPEQSLKKAAKNGYK